MQEHPPLEAVVREALYHALEEARRGLDSDQKEAYAAWFAFRCCREARLRRAARRSKRDRTGVGPTLSLRHGAAGWRGAGAANRGCAWEPVDYSRRQLPGDARYVASVAHRTVASAAGGPLSRPGRASGASPRVDCR